MHDPLVVAFEIRRPWPGHFRRVREGQPHWRVKLHHRCRPSCDHPPMRWGGFPPWKLSSYSSHWNLAGWEMYWPSLVTVWHREPGGHDSGTVCPHYVRWRGPDDKWRTKYLHAWKFHVHHWRIQVPMAQEARRWLFQRCAWCGGPSRRGNLVNVSHSWSDRHGLRFWQPQPHLYHAGCSSAVQVSGTCVCDVPMVTGRYSECARCHKSYRDHASWETTRRAISIAGTPEEGRPWRWPREVNYDAVKAELEAEYGESVTDG